MLYKALICIYLLYQYTEKKKNALRSNTKLQGRQIKKLIIYFRMTNKYQS